MKKITTREHDRLVEFQHIAVALDVLLELSYKVRDRMDEDADVFELIEQVTNELKESLRVELPKELALEQAKEIALEKSLDTEH